ncbi:30S ribosomal protein S5 [Mesomycoplasma conjunctivae]|uniref:30S ribosomal protein S5 n=1 Tax=Mesomycoplasma conjunctivae TaxID=45361 RepID=UPI003DA222FC
MEAKQEVKMQPTQVIAPDKKIEKSEKPKRFSNPKRATQNKERFNKVVEFEERVIDVARVTTVVKGGRRFSFSAHAVVGNKKGKVGFGHGKANEVQDAIKKAVKDAQNNLISVPIVNGTIPHEVKNEKYLASKILLKPAPKGKGIVASNTVRAVVELAGYTDIYSKTYGSRTKINVVRAALKALQKLKTVKEIAELRDIDVKTLLQK